MSPTPAESRRTLRRPPGRVAAVHQQGGAWRVVIAEIGGSGAESPRQAVRVIDARTLDAPRLPAFLREHRAARVITVVPAAATVCRSIALPEGNPAEVTGALALLAEAELPASIPAHRRAGGVVAPGPAGSPPLALLIGWPERESPGTDPLESLPEHTRLWIPEPVALASLAAAHGGCSMALYADRRMGSIALLGAGPTRSVARILRADATTEASWRASITDAVDRLGDLLDAPVNAPDIDADPDQLLSLDSADTGRATPPLVPGAKSDPDWTTAYGIPLGALLADATATVDLDPLLSLRPESLTRGGTLPDRLITWLASPGRAAAVIAASLALVLLVPLGVAAARAAALERQAGSADALRERLETADREAAFYDLLRARRWPMTKLLADVAGAAPIGIRVESIELSGEGGAGGGGGGGPGLLVRGTAPSADAVTEFAANLAATRIVTDIATPSIAAEGLGVLFQLQARVVAPLFRAPPAEDFAAQTLAQRLYGDAASRIRLVDSGDADPDAARPEPRRSSRRDAPESATPDSPDPAPPPAGEPPPPLTDDAIAAMDRAALIKEFAARRRAQSLAAAGTPDRQRLDDEVDKLRQRLDALRSGGGR